MSVIIQFSQRWYEVLKGVRNKMFSHSKWLGFICDTQPDSGEYMYRKRVEYWWSHLLDKPSQFQANWPQLIYNQGRKGKWDYKQWLLAFTFSQIWQCLWLAYLSLAKKAIFNSFHNFKPRQLQILIHFYCNAFCNHLCWCFMIHFLLGSTKA